MTVPDFIPAGYTLLRPLSVRPGSWVFLALNPSGAHACLKVQKATRPEALDELAHVRRQLEPLLPTDGFIPMRRWGIDRPSSCLWEELDLADDSVTGRRFDPKDASLYTPLTLATQVSEAGPVPTLDVLQQGIRIAGALSRLHAAGLFHRDIKPANILLRGGAWVLGDYGSVGEAGASVEFPGTEGYVPPDGLGSPALDVFALGRSLYEAWTGLDRFHFPSLPPGHPRSPEWSRHGWCLNDVLLKAGNPRPSERCPTAADLRLALERALAGRRRISRRGALLAGLGASASGFGAYVWRNLPSHRAVWRKLPPQRFGMEAWKGSELTCDWARRRIYSGAADSRGIIFHSYNFQSWTNTARLLPVSGLLAGDAVLSPDGTALDVLANVSGEVFRIQVATGTVRRLGIAVLDDNAFVGRPYFNPLNGRVGRLFGYGDFMAHNRRYELDEPALRWLEVPPSGPVPWPRYHNTLCFPSADRLQWWAFGGIGNPSGKQSDRSLGTEGYDGRFYELNDLWRLDLKTGRWTQFLPYRRWNPRNLASAIVHPPTSGVAFLTGSARGAPGEAAFHLWQGDPDRNPVRLPNAGDRIAMYQFWSLIREPETHHLWVFADEGVFAVELKEA